MVIEPAPILGGWKSVQKLSFKHFTKEAIQGNNQVFTSTDNPAKVMMYTKIMMKYTQWLSKFVLNYAFLSHQYQRHSQITLSSAELAKVIRNTFLHWGGGST